MTTLSKNHPDPGPDESWPTRTFSRFFSETASIRNSSTLEDIIVQEFNNVTS